MTQISIIIPCYNVGTYINETVESILKQTWPAEGQPPEVEILIVDDRSTDPETLSCLDALPLRDSRVRVLVNTGAKGAGAARNFGARYASGDWLAFLDADDVWLPEAIFRRWQAIQQNPDIEWVSTDYQMLYEDGHVGPPGLPKQAPKIDPVFAEAFRQKRPMRLVRPVEESLRYYLAWTGTVMVTKDLFRRVGGFNETLLQCEDFHLWILLAKEADLLFLPESLALYRQRAGSLTNDLTTPAAWQVLMFQKLLRDNRYAGYRGLIREELVRFAEMNVYFYRRRGDGRSAAKASVDVLMADPVRVRGWKNLVASLLGR